MLEVCTCCTFLNGSLQLGTVSCSRPVCLSETILRKQMGNSCHPRMIPSYVSCVGTNSRIENKCPSGTGCPRLTFLLPLFIQTGPKGSSTSLARGACPCSPASTWRRAMGPCPPSRSPRSCRPTTLGRDVTGRPTRRNPFRNYVVGFPLWGFSLINCF